MENKFLPYSKVDSLVKFLENLWIIQLFFIKNDERTRNLRFVLSKTEINNNYQMWLLQNAQFSQKNANFGTIDFFRFSGYFSLPEISGQEFQVSGFRREFSQCILQPFKTSKSKVPYQL